jgi:hypothetical protein
MYIYYYYYYYLGLSQVMPDAVKHQKYRPLTLYLCVCVGIVASSYIEMGVLSWEHGKLT